MGIRILHLSDLHISSSEDNSFTILRNSILEYIKGKNVDVDIIAFTGDIIDRNDKAAFPIAVEFFKSLLDTCNLKSDRLMIVPGNHDMKRDDTLRNILDSEKIKSVEYVKENWEYLKVRMQGYSDFVKKLGIADKKEFEDGYGIKTVQIGDKTICFNLLNSAWSSRGNDDYRNLVVGRWQLEENRAELEKIANKDIVITMVHHPLAWLTDAESDMMRDYLCHHGKLASCLLFHGHIHDSKTQREMTPAGGFTTLITGIGYPMAKEREANQPKICECKFSIYDIDVENKMVDNFCLTSTARGDFVPDTKLYNGSEDGHYKFSLGNMQEMTTKGQENECMELDSVPVINCWSGRTEELDLLSKENTNIIAISGVGGQGKTALAAKFMRETPETVKKFDKKLWVDCRELPNTMHIKLLSLLESITGGRESATAYRDEQLSDTIKRFFKHISEERILIVFDNVDAYVNLENEELVGELSDIVEVALTQQHNSLLILTCRIPIYDSRANFRTIKLDGLKEPEGIEFLRARGVEIAGAEDEISCKQIIRIIKGHPWWLGLIAGQMVSTKVSPKEYLDENRDGILARDSQVEKFFGSIWEKLNTNRGKVAKEIIRYLSETTRPLTAQDLSLLLGENYKNTYKAVKMLINLNLLIEHEEREERGKSFQVHPLVREFIHKNYDKTIQKPFVDKLVKMIIGNKLYTIIFVNAPDTISRNMDQWNSRDIIDSIETCLTSRNDVDALTILSSTHEILVNDGHHAEFLSLAERVLNSVNWKKEEMGTNKKRAAFLSQYLDLLVLQEQSKPKVEFYLTNYENSCEKNTIPYSGFSGTKAFVLWRCERLGEAMQAFRDYEAIQDKTNEAWGFFDMENLKGTILRETGDITGALEVFEKTSDSSVKYGNIARCYQILGKYDLALDNLKISLSKLANRDNLFIELVNRGYAYLWIAEIYYEMGEKDKAEKFLLLCQETWKEYSPGLLSKTSELLRKMGDIEMQLNPSDIKQMLDDFLKNVQDAE